MIVAKLRVCQQPTVLIAMVDREDFLPQEVVVLIYSSNLIIKISKQLNSVQICFCKIARRISSI